MTVNDANNRAPQFVGVAGGVVDIQVDQATGPGLDLAHLVGGGQLGVYDDDLSELRQRLTLSVDNEDDLVVLPEVLAARKRNPTNATDPLMASVQYPRFALKRRLSQDTTFNLIATVRPFIGTPNLTGRLNLAMLFACKECQDQGIA